MARRSGYGLTARAVAVFVSKVGHLLEKPSVGRQQGLAAFFLRVLDVKCLNPVFVWANDVYVGCGKCGPCRSAKAHEWANRIVHELEYMRRGVFATLTYEVPPVSLSVSKRELQLFFKRLRRVFTRRYLGSAPKVRNPWYDPDRVIKYYACGEYGEIHGLPHYHAIILGVGLDDCILTGSHYVTGGPLQLAWNRDSIPMSQWRERGALGYIYVGTVTVQSARYVTDYVQKSFFSPPPSGGPGGGGAPPATPFQVVSQGLGLRYVVDNREQLVADGYCRIEGVQQALPRYYQKKLADVDATDVAQVTLTPEVRRERAIERHDEVLAEAVPVSATVSKSIVRRRFFQRVMRDESLREVALKTLEGMSADRLQDDEAVFVAVRRAVLQDWRNRAAKSAREKKSSPF